MGEGSRESQIGDVDAVRVARFRRVGAGCYPRLRGRRLPRRWSPTTRRVMQRGAHQRADRRVLSERAGAHRNYVAAVRHRAVVAPSSSSRGRCSSTSWRRASRRPISSQSSGPWVACPARGSSSRGPWSRTRSDRSCGGARRRLPRSPDRRPPGAGSGAPASPPLEPASGCPNRRSRSDLAVRWIRALSRRPVACRVAGADRPAQGPSAAPERPGPPRQAKRRRRRP